MQNRTRVKTSRKTKPTTTIAAPQTSTHQPETLDLTFSKPETALMSGKLAGAQRRDFLLQIGQGYGNQSVQRLLAKNNTVQRAVANPPNIRPMLKALEKMTSQQLRDFIKALQTGPYRDKDESTMPPIVGDDLYSLDEALTLIAAAKVRLVPLLMEDLANARDDLATEITNTTEDERHAMMVRLHTEIDKPRLDELRPLVNERPNRWEHPDASVEDSVLSAIQLEAVMRAEAYLDDPKKAHEDAYKAVGMEAADEWCGFFVVNNWMTSQFDKDLRGGLFHTLNIPPFFSYEYVADNPGQKGSSRSKKWMWADNSWQVVEDYHNARGAPRTWMGAQAIHDAIAADQPLDIRSGDVVLLDHSGSPEADHIQMVESYDPATRHLTYIDGNGGGYVVDNASDETKRAKSDNNAADTDSRHTTETATAAVM